MKTMKKIFLGEVQTTFVDAKKPIEKSIRCSLDANNLIREMMGDQIRIKQMMTATFLNRGNQVMFAEILTIGDAEKTIIPNKEIVRKAILSGCEAVILAHNHTGTKTPSESDKRETKAIKEGLKMFDIKLLDHLILTGSDYYSFADNCERSLA